MKMAKVKTAELEGLALDWIVDGIESGQPLEIHQHKSGSGEWIFAHNGVPCPLGPRKFSTDGNLGIGVISAHLLVISPEPSKGWLARSYMDATEYYGPTPLIAAMRCLVASHLGDEVLIPQELLP